MAYALVLSGTHDTAVLDSVWNQRSTLTAYGQALLGLAMLEMNDGRANDLSKQIEAEAKQDDSQAWWPSDNNYLMDFYGDTTPRDNRVRAETSGPHRRRAARCCRRPRFTW